MMLRDSAIDLASIDSRFANLLTSAVQDTTGDIQHELCRLIRERIDTDGSAKLRLALSEISRTQGALTAGDLSRHLGMSLRMLQRLFESQLGLTPSAFIGLARVQEARRALASTARFAMADLALSLGYYDQAHFTNHFKAVCGQSPARGGAVLDVAFFQDQDCSGA